ncbi:substrate-binding domain-containing protein [Mameliella sp. CS4]|uniref:LacI family DNA-binding transcriptional regulator n=1 Tax=Mameliella sp. CS4 TaxID=2862329 RepID=UPI001C5EADE3|nr:substrate-binding domain-containing protein [Mameliella sp. CS4]
MKTIKNGLCGVGRAWIGGRDITREDTKGTWKGPTIQEVAEVSGVGIATVDRVLNNRPGVREKTRERVRAAFDKLRLERLNTPALRIALHCESGESFNEAIETAVQRLHRKQPGITLTSTYAVPNDLDANVFAADLLDRGRTADASIVVAREHPAINSAIRQLRRLGKPVVCLTTDLPSSRRSAYVGNDQSEAGAVAAQVIGRAMPRAPGQILLIMSVAYRCQKEREMGFRRVLRARFPHLRIEERLFTDERPETMRSQLVSHFEANGVPPAIYNVAGANRGVAQALDVTGEAPATLFVGHELTPVTQRLLKAGTMDFVVAHDFQAELTQAARWISDSLNGVESEPAPSQIMLHTRFNCSV